MSGFSWVTLATNDSYSLGALVLAHSLKRVGTAHQLVVMVTPGVTPPMREKLRNVFDLVFEVNILDSKDERNLLLLQRPELGITFTKLHCWRLTQYEKCVFLDADTLVLQNCDELFDRDEFSAAPDVGWPDCFNSGVFVYKPSDETFNSLLSFALEKGSFDGGDQGLLNLYFSDWAHKDISKHLPFIYNMCSTACYSYLPAFKQFGENVKIIHFIGNSKPWLQYFNSETLQVSCTPGFDHLQLVFEHWWNLFCSHVHSGLQPTMARINTPIASSCTSSSHILAYNVNESKCEDSLCTEQFCGTDVNDIPVWDPWENYQPVDCSLENKSTDSFIVNNLNNEQSSSSYYVENIENKIESSFHESCNYSTQSNDVSNNVNVEYVEYKSHINIDNSAHSSKQDEHVTHVSITNDPLPNSCTYSQPQPPDPSSPSAYQSVTSTVVCDAKSASTVTITTEQPATHASKTKPRTDSNGGLAGAFAQMTLREPRSASQGALEEHLRRQGWEAGRIDYLGQDSFDNVWKKICETMATAPKKEPSPPKQVAAAVSEPVVVARASEPVVAVPAPASVVAATAAPVPIVDAAAPVPVVADAAPAPVVSATAPVPVVAAAVPAPVIAAVAPVPVVDASAPTPVVDAPAPTPVVDVPAPVPVVDAPAPTPVVDAAAPVPVVAAPAPEPEVAAPTSTSVVGAAASASVLATPAPEPTIEFVATPAPTPSVEPIVASAPAAEPIAAPIPSTPPAFTETASTPAPTVEPVVVTTQTPVVESATAPSSVEAVISLAAAAESVAALAPISEPAPATTPIPAVSAPAPDAEPAAAPVAESTLKSSKKTAKEVPTEKKTTESVATCVATESAPAPDAEPAAAPVAESTLKSSKKAAKEVPTEKKPTESVATGVATEPPKTETKAVEVQKSAGVPAAKTEKVKPAVKSTTSVATEQKKETAKSKVESAEGQSSESTPVPPPRKSGKNGGATAKKTTKKK